MEALKTLTIATLSLPCFVIPLLYSLHPITTIPQSVLHQPFPFGKGPKINFVHPDIISLGGLSCMRSMQIPFYSSVVHGLLKVEIHWVRKTNTESEETRGLFLFFRIPYLVSLHKCYELRLPAKEKNLLVQLDKCNTY